MRKAKLLNVKRHLERVENLLQALIRDNNPEKLGAVCIPPAYLDEMKSLSFMTRAILKKHSETLSQGKPTRKDIRLERRD